MVKIANKELYTTKMDSRKLEKIQIYPSKQHCGYNKMSNQLPKITKTIMSPLTTMPPKKMMIAPQNGGLMKPNPPAHINLQAKIEPMPMVNHQSQTMQISAIKNNFIAKNVMSSPSVVAQPKTELNVTESAKATAAGYRSEKISLDDVHPYITCFLCRGYLIEATTIVECLHTYCHSCLMKHLAKEKCCPQCDMSINKSKTNIKYDATIQSIVYKLVPGLYQRELMRRRAFYRQRPEEAKLATPEERGDDTEHLILGPLDLMSLSLDYAEKETLKGMEADDDIQNLLKAKYLNCPAIFKVEHLKKFIVSKFNINCCKFNVEISYKVKTIVLPEHYTLMDVAYIYTWKKEAPMPFFFRIIAKNSKCDELPEVALRRSPTTTLPNVADEVSTKKKSVSFKEEVEAIGKKQESGNKVGNGLKSRPADYPPNAPRIETIKLKLDVSNNNVSIIKNTTDSTPKSEAKHKHKKEKKNKLENLLPKYSIDKEKPLPKDSKKDEYEFDDDIDQQKLGFLNTFQLTAKKILDAKTNANVAKPGCNPPTINRNNLSQKQTESSINKRKSKEPVKSTTKKYKFHEMKSVGEGNKFLFTKTGDGHEITFDMSPKPLGSKPSLSKVKSDILQAQQRADAKANKEMNKTEIKSPPIVEQPSVDKSNNLNQRNVPSKPKKLPLLLPKQPSPVTTPQVAPAAMSPTAFVIKKPEAKKDFQTSEISVTKVSDPSHCHRVYGPKSPVSKPPMKEPAAAPLFKSPDGFAQPLPPKMKSNASLPAPTHILKPYGNPIKMPTNIPENMQTSYGCRTPFYVPSSPSYTPNFDPKPQFKYANPNAYASFMQSMFCAPNPGKISPPINNSMSSPKTPVDSSRKRSSTDNKSSPIPLKRKSPSPTKSGETDSKAISILNNINFPSSLSVTITNEQEENKKEQLRSQKQSVVNNNIEIIKLSEEKDSKTGAAGQALLAKTPSTSPTDKKPSSDKKNAEPRKSPPTLPALVPNPTALFNANQILSPPIAKALTESKESFQRAFLESLMSVAGKQTVEKNSAGRKKESGKSSATEMSGKDDKDKLMTEIKIEENAISSEQQRPLLIPKSFSRTSEFAQPQPKKSSSLTPPPSKSLDKMIANSSKSLTPPPTAQDFASNHAAQMQINMMFNALAGKTPQFSYPAAEYMHRTMLLETLRQSVEKSSAYLALQHQMQQLQQQQNQKNPSSSHSPSSSASSPSSKH